MSTKFDLDLHMFRLMDAEPFFAAISRRIDKRPSTQLPTAGVRVNPETAQLEMLYNPNFFQKLIDDHKAMYDNLSKKERTAFDSKYKANDDTRHFRWVRGVLLHELYHIVFGHVSDRLPDGKMNKRWNIATDLAINSYLTECIPPIGLLPGQGQFADVPSHQTAEWYYKNLPEDMGKENGEGGEGEGEGDGEEQGQGQGQGQGSPGDSFDDHSGWGDVPDDVKQQAEERMRQILADAAQEANSKGWGSVSSSVRQDVMERIRPKVNWKAVLRYFIKTSQRADRNSTVKRLNKRFQFIHPGKKVNRTAKIAISIDQSGSVSDSMLIAFFSELDNLAKYAEFTVVPFDTEVATDKIYVWKKGQRHKAERVRYGGTCFDAPTKWVNEHAFDGHIVLTDMEAPKPIPSRIQRMWMTTRAHAERPYFQPNSNEKIIAIDEPGVS
jgi:predicted metal-dependent peptidase